MREAFDAGPPPESRLAYIGDMLDELAQLASQEGHDSLAVAIRLAGVLAVRELGASGRPSSAPEGGGDGHG